MQFSLLKLFNSNVLRKILFYIIKSERVFIPLVLMPKLRSQEKYPFQRKKEVTIQFVMQNPALLKNREVNKTEDKMLEEN